MAYLCIMTTKKVGRTINKAFYFLNIGIYCLLLTACVSNGRLERSLEAAGDNRKELEHVLKHYKGDSLKYQAACYLIEHMQGCYTYKAARIDSLKSLKWMSVTRGDEAWMDSVKRIWDSFSYLSAPKVYDARVITADYLIKNIDHAFKVWYKQPWAKYYTFDDFCRYVLPYRVGDEPLEWWRELYHDRYARAIDSMYRGSDIVQAVQAVREKFLEEGFAWNTNFSLPHLGASFLLDHRVGYCRESCDFTVYLLRSLGMPVATDCYLSSPQTSGAHSWTVLKDTTGAWVPFWLMETEVERGVDDGRPKGKVFRKMYWGEQVDVTHEYFGENQAEIEVECPQGIDNKIYLCVFSCGNYTPVDVVEQRRGKAVFHNLEPDIWFLPMYKEKSRKVFFPAGFAFSLDKEGKVKNYIPDTLHRRKAALLRKYSYSFHLKERMDRLAGSRIEGSRTADFCNPVLLGCLGDSNRTNRIEIFPGSSSPFRYIRLLATPSKYEVEVAEIEFYEAGTSRKLPVHLWDIPKACGANNAAKMMTDGDVLSFYSAAEIGDKTLIFDLKEEYPIGKIVFVPRNDDNFIRPGDEYELLYQDGVRGWKSLGRQIAEGCMLEYTNIPKGALLWLRDLTRGREEQLFIVTEEGEQVFV